MSSDLSLQPPAMGDSARCTDQAETTTAIAYPADGRHSGDPFGQRRTPLLRRIGGALAAVAALAAKFGSYLKGALILLPKLKLLATAGTAFVSIAGYSLLWGWRFAAGFVALLFVHEMGHVLQLRREGIKASAPMFIPFAGAVVFARLLENNALAEARVGLAGPLLGTLGAAAVAAAGAFTHSDLLLALAYFAFFINLLNLIPVVPFDGGRAMAAVAPVMWFVGIAGLLVLIVVFANPFLLLFVVFALVEMPRRWRQLRSRSLESAAYYRVPRRSRLAVGAIYLSLIVALVVGMDTTHVLSSAGHSFR